MRLTSRKLLVPEPRRQQPSGDRVFSVGRRSASVPASLCLQMSQIGAVPSVSCRPVNRMLSSDKAARKRLFSTSPEGSKGAAVAGGLRDLGDHQASGTMGALDAAGIHFQTMRRGTSRPGP